MVKEYRSDTCRVLLIVRPAGWAELYVYDLTRPDHPAFHHAYEAGQKLLWQRDLDTLIGAIGAEEVEHAA